MSRDGTGVFTIPYPDFQSGAIISDTEMDANNADIISELTNSLPRDGQAAPTANIPFGTYKITGLGAGAAATDSANLGQVQAQAYIWCATATGSKNALALTPSPPITAYAAGQAFRFKSGTTASDDAVTVAVSGLATKAIQSSGAALSASVYIAANQWYEIVYDGAAFQLNKISSPDGIFSPIASPTQTGTTSVSNLVATGITSLATTSVSSLVATGTTSLATTSISALTGTTSCVNLTASGVASLATTNITALTATSISAASIAGVASYGRVKALINFNGTSTPTARGTPYNVTSITDNGTGNYTLNLTTALADTNGIVLVTGMRTSGNVGYWCGGQITGVSTVLVTTGIVSDAIYAATDYEFIHVAVFA